jgi:RNA polymerase sigma factor (sigma-70 family)
MSNAAVVQMLDRLTGSNDGETDAHLLGRFLAARDEDAFAGLVRRHGRLVYGVCQRILGNRTDADDAFQAIFFVLARRAPALELDRGIAPWLHGVALRVAQKARAQTVRRRLREMAAARSERVNAAETGSDFWAIIDQEVARLPLPLREAVQLCDLGGQSHAQAAESMGVAKGTVTKRLAKAHGELALRLKRRGISLGVGALSTVLAARAPATVPVSLLSETARQAVAFSAGRVSGSLAAQSLAEGVMRSIKACTVKVWLVVGLLGLALAGGGLMLAGGPDDPGPKTGDRPKATDAAPGVATGGTAWRECFTGEYESSLPVSVAFAEDGKTLLSGDTSGDIMATRLPSDPPTYRWKTSIGGTHAAVAYSADQRHVYATTEHGVRILDATTGKEVARIDQPTSNPIALGVFPNKIDAKFPQVQIVFGNARGYFVKTWADPGNPANTMGTLEIGTVAKGAEPADVAAVPLAVDPKGRSAIMTGLRDGTGEFTGVKGKNVLWAHVCGDYSKDSPGNRVMVGHAATVVSAAWSKDGGTAATGDAAGRVIVWDAKTMKEARRVELGGRVMALAISPDGTHTAACVRGKQGGEFYVWETAKPTNAMRPIHTQPGDFSSEPYASLSFSTDGKRLAGLVVDKKWLKLDPKPLPLVVSGQVHVWELAAEPKAQLPPKHLYDKPLPKGSSPHFVIVNNSTFYTVTPKEGSIGFHDIRDGHIQAIIGLGKFAIGGIKLSSDRKWVAIEQHPETPAETFDVGVYAWPPIPKATIPSCTQLLDVASGGKIVAVVREKQIELWDSATTKKLKAAPFPFTRIDAAQFSPDGKLLAISDRNELVLWRWEEGKHERLDLGRRVRSLTFTPDGRFLADGPTPGDSIQIRDVETLKVVQTLVKGTRQSMNVPRMAYAQGGRVLIACDAIEEGKDGAVRHRVDLWDTASNSVAHQIVLPAGSLVSIDLTSNGRYLAAMVDGGEAGLTLSVWRLDGEMPETDAGPMPPAAVRPR